MDIGRGDLCVRASTLGTLECLLLGRGVEEGAEGIEDRKKTLTCARGSVPAGSFPLSSPPPPKPKNFPFLLSLLPSSPQPSSLLLPLNGEKKSRVEIV